MIIKVTQEHYDNATRQQNPIALACQDAWPKPKVEIFSTILYLNGQTVGLLPIAARRVLSGCKHGIKMKPTEFEIKVPLLLRLKLWYESK